MRLLGSLLLVVACVPPTAKEARAPASPPTSATEPVAVAAAPRPTDSDAPGALAPPADRCPAEPETKNNYQDDDGCPDELPADLAAALGVIAGLEFDIDKDTIRPSSFAALERLVHLLQRHPDLRFEIADHEANDDREEYGRCLTCRRAAAVKRYLVEHGVEAGRLEATGRGPDEPIDSNKTAAGRAKNRRTELRLLPPAPPRPTP